MGIAHVKVAVAIRTIRELTPSRVAVNVAAVAAAANQETKELAAIALTAVKRAIMAVAKIVAVAAVQTNRQRNQLKMNIRKENHGTIPRT